LKTGPGSDNQDADAAGLVGRDAHQRYPWCMSPRDARLQAAALRLAAERLERGEALAPALADALAEDMSRHPEELAAVEAHEGTLPDWMAEELDRRDQEDAGTEEDGEVVMARLLAKHSRPLRSA
jgi:hypothetical protein